MSKQDILAMAMILSAFKGMGASEMELEAERRLMEIDADHLTYNMYLIGLSDTIEDSLTFAGVI